jgi:hypothetical protein
MMRQSALRTVSGQTIQLNYKKPGPKPLPLDLKKRRVNGALDPHWHGTGKRVAAEKELSFSAYIEWLIYTDSLCNESV